MSASFDVIGTCFGFQEAIAAISEHFSEPLSRGNVDAKTFFFTWFYAAQRDFTYTSVCGSYTPIASILKTTLPRAFRIVDVHDADATPEKVDAVMAAFKAMAPRPGLKKCIDGLRAYGFDVYGVTNGGKETSLGYYRKAGIELADDHLLSCDDLKAAKPDQRVYENAAKVVQAAGCSGKERWFVAAHSWDLIAARRAGFKMAWVACEEHDPVTEVFGKFDIYAENFDELLEKMTKVELK